MGLTLAQKLIKAHLVEGEMIPGKEIGLKIDPDSDSGRNGNHGLS